MILKRTFNFFCLALSALCLGACGSLHITAQYYWQAATGHLSLLHNAQAIEHVLQHEKTSPALKHKLKLAQQARQFASQQLALPDNASYTRFTQLPHDYVVWNVFATQPLSLQLEQSCFLIVGCVGYRGYYQLADAQAHAATLKAQGLDVRVAGVAAYSTLGWSDDPIPSSLLRYSDLDVVKLIFHELAHQILYVKNDTTFNESFATAVEEEGLKRWLANQASTLSAQNLAEQLDTHQAAQWRKNAVMGLLNLTKNQLVVLYKSNLADAEKLQQKVAILQQLKTDYTALKTQWQALNPRISHSGFDAWFGIGTGGSTIENVLGNAHFAALAAYNDAVPQFKQLLLSCGNNLPRFYAQVKFLAQVPKTSRAFDFC